VKDMRLTLSTFENDETEKADAKKYWAEQNKQPLTYDLKSHYVEAIAEILRFVDARSVFEFGCAAGRNLKSLQETLADELDSELVAKGIDVNEAAIKKGRKKHGLDISVADDSFLSNLQADEFDLVFTVSVLDHVPVPGKILSHLMNITKQFAVFIEPWLELDESEYGKVATIGSKWSRRNDEEIIPYTYVHDYPKIISDAGCELVLRIPFPTHINRSGPTYHLWLVGKEKDIDIDSDTIAILKEKIISSAMLQLLENVTDLRARISNLKKEKEAEERKFKSLQVMLNDTQLQLATTRDSITFRIGAMFVKDIKRPLHWAFMPVKLFRIFRLFKKRKLKKKVIRKKQYKFLDELLITDQKTLIPIEGRVCYMLHNSLPYASGGYATRSHGVVMALASQGFDVRVVTRAGYPLDVKDTAFTSAEDSVIDGIQYRRILDPTIKGEKLENYMRKSIQAYIDVYKEIRPACVIAASSFRHALPSIIAAKRLGIPTIYEVRGFWEVTRISREPDFESSSNYKYQKKMEAETAIAADAVITLTAAMKQELVDRGVPGSKIALAPNACNPEKLIPIEKSMALAESFGISEDIPVIGYIGSWVHYEGLDDLVSALALLYKKGIEFRCLLVGSENVATSDRGPIFESISKVIEGSGFEDWVIMPGRVPFDQVQDYYSLVDIAPFPRKPLPVTEMVSPMKPLEAMAMEKAVVVSSVGALSEMVEDGVTGLVFQKGNVADLSDKLQLLINDRNLRKELGKNGRNFVLTERNWNSVMDAFIKEISALSTLQNRAGAKPDQLQGNAVVGVRPQWWHLLPDDFACRCHYISIKDWYLSDKTKELVKRYDKKFGRKQVRKRISGLNWKRADVCCRLVPDDVSILDIGSGLGEFVNLVAMNNPQVDITSVDNRDYDLWFDSTGKIQRVYKDIFDLKSDQQKDIVTCFEVIEHLPPSRLKEAVDILHSLARKKLYVSVPFMEGPPLYHGHFTRFTAENIQELFPNASYTVFGKNDGSTDTVSAWILCEVEF
jgi:glycosyltransferase involved in cell wall biosynthesis/2-polyprenyl-3-methyl-5-hydroxy-6-metoxy-1,4-benzoquinol methylase